MFGRGKKIKEHGAQAKAVVLAADMGGMTNSHGERHWKVTLNVQFDDGSTSEVKTSLWRMMGGSPSVGTIVPVRYDPDDRSKVEIDVAAFDAGKAEALDEARAKLIQASEERLAKGED
jgi:hypothetical protein